MRVVICGANGTMGKLLQQRLEQQARSCSSAVAEQVGTEQRQETEPELAMEM